MRTAALCLILAACTDKRTGCPGGDGYDAYHCIELFEMNEPYRDAARLLATTTGSPSSFTCPNKLHRMRVQVATTQSNKEAATLVFCECQRESGAAGEGGE